ncbi:MAG: hypothetical protein ABIQ99_11510 [Thermoflexales bacterium]
MSGSRNRFAALILIASIRDFGYSSGLVLLRKFDGNMSAFASGPVSVTIELIK